jgi:glycolate oxidase iron-sulfur subunit
MSHHTSQDHRSAYDLTLDCVHCGLCLPACPTYKELGAETDSPRGRIYMVRALAEGRLDDTKSVQHHLNRCLDCRACETTCPSGVQYGAILESTRADLEKKHPTRGLRAFMQRLLLRHVVIHQRRLRAVSFVVRAAERVGLRWLARKVGVLPAKVDALAPHMPSAKRRRPLPTGIHSPRSKPRGRVGLFTGCVMEPMFGDVNRATLQLLLANGFEVVVPAAQRCCGALLVHAGLPEDARPLAEANLAAFRDVDIVVNNSAGCGCMLREYEELLGSAAAAEFSAKCRDISEFLADVGLQAKPGPVPTGTRAAYDDPCHLCHGQGVRAQPRALLRQVPGLELVNHGNPEDCCGSAGIYNLMQPELAAEIGRKKADSLMAADVHLVVTGNPGCMIQIGAHLRQRGNAPKVVHPVELLLPDTKSK